MLYSYGILSHSNSHSATVDHVHVRLFSSTINSSLVALSACTFHTAQFKGVCQGLSGHGAGGSANAYRLCRIMSKVCCQ